MKKYFCDKCGKEMKGDYSYQVVILPGVVYVSSIKSKQQWDLCEECFELLDKHLKNKYGGTKKWTKKYNKLANK